MTTKGVRLILILCAVCLLISSCAALKITGAICEKKISSGATFICPVVLETESPAIVTLETFGKGYTITKDELAISPNSPGEFIIKGTAPATGYIKITAIDDDTGGQVQYEVSTYLKVCVNSPCPTIPRPPKTTPTPTTIEPTITTPPYTTTPTDVVTTPYEVYHKEQFSWTPYGSIIALLIALFIAIGIIILIRDRRRK